MTINEFSGIITALSTISMAVVAAYSIKIRTAAKNLYYNDTPQNPITLQNILFSNNPNDGINKRINEIVEEIKINLEPIYKDKQFKWKKQLWSDFAKIGNVCNYLKFCIF